MNHPSAKAIRQAFLDFFASKQHQIVPSAPIIVKNDPTLMFTNAGMNPFKELFLGETAIKYARIADTQRCLRVSGKHNDLEEVGIDTYHHTMFEMLGNWSFGDYFKAEAIAWSWELLTEVYHLPKERLYVTVFEGDEKEKLPAASIALREWKKLVDDEHIVYGNKKDNFWEMGETGPCGPCSEIHVDLRSDEERAHTPGKNLVNKDHPQVIEIWNNVFIQYNRRKDGTLEELPSKHVDTGMGLERLVRVIQGKSSNYDTDIFQPLIQFIAKHSNTSYGKNEQTDIALRVIADHIRAISFAIADGQLPSNNKAGYVIRRILRRAVRYGYTFLNLKEPFLYQLVHVLAEQFDGVFPELIQQQHFVEKVIQEEETTFLRTLATGIQRFEKYIETEKNNIIDGAFAFELYDTYGFPIDLTQLMAREKNRSIDMDDFEKCLAQQRSRSRAATTVDTDDWTIVHDNNHCSFVGYDYLANTTQIAKYRKITSKEKEQYHIVLHETPFYAESGGQVGDTGVLKIGNDQIKVVDTKKENNLIIHVIEKLPQNLQASIIAEVNAQTRTQSENNHSATHLLQAALRQVLGAHVQQKGSLVNSDYLRFDFSHFTKLTEQELIQVEKLVNQKIRQNIPLQEQRTVPYQQAIEEGVTALFGEKYGEFVRVITFDETYSKELCGGTHVKSTGQIGFFKIINESAVAAGVRRIEAITAEKAEQYIVEQNQLISQLKELLKNPTSLILSTQHLLEENNRLKKELEKTVTDKIIHLKQKLATQINHIGDIQLIAQYVELPHTDAIKNLAFALKECIPNLVLVLTANIEEKPHITILISENLVKTKNLDANKMIRELAKEIQGGGGGQSFFATAGGKNMNGLKMVISKAIDYLKNQSEISN